MHTFPYYEGFSILKNEQIVDIGANIRIVKS